MNIGHVSHPDERSGLPLLGGMKKIYTRREALGLGGRFALCAGLGMAGVLASGCNRESQPGVDKKAYHNVVLISIDTLRADHLSCYGYFRATSPNIDKFAEESLVFTNAFAAAPMTLSSHMSMFTSVTPKVHGVIYADNSTYSVLPEAIQTLPEILHQKGFTNYGYVNNYFQLDAKYGFGRGFPNRFDMSDQREPGYYGYRKVHLFDQHRYELKGNAPVFLFYHTFTVHCSELDAWPYIYDGPPEFRDRFLPGGKAVPFNHSVRKVWEGKEKITEEELKQVIARYDGGILDADHEIAELFDLLKEEDLYDNSLIILTADHGECLGDRDSVGVATFSGHGWLYNVGLHVPLMIKFPKGFKYGGPVTGKVDDFVRSIDILPTVLDSLSIESPTYIEGQSLLRVEEDRVCIGQIQDSYGYGTREFRVLFDSSPDLSEIRQVQIYDVRNDPAELNNIFESGETRSTELLQIAEEAHRKTLSLCRTLEDPDKKVQPLSEEAVRGLKALGYLGD